MKAIGIMVGLILFATAVLVAQQTVTTTGGTANSVPKFSGSNTIVNSAITENNGQVGIGTTTPSRTLDVQGTVNVHSSVLIGLDNSQGATFFVNGPIWGQFQRAFLYGTGKCCNAGVGSSGGSSLGSTAGFSSAFNGAFFNSNGTADGDDIAGAQITTSLPSWRMALGSGTSEWPGGDNFAIGRVAAGGNYQAPSILFTVSNGGFAKVAGGIVFPDNTTQTTAQVEGPPGPQGPAGPTGAQGPQGPQGPPGPQITTTYRAFCAGPFGSSDSVVLNPLGQTAFPNCWLIYNGFTVRYVPEFGNGLQSGDFPIYIDSPADTTVDTQYGFAVPRAGTLANLRVSAITGGSSSTSGKVLVRKIFTNNRVDNTSSDVLLSCTVGTGTSCTNTTHTLSIAAGERILVTVGTGPSETLTSISVLVDLQ